MYVCAGRQIKAGLTEVCKALTPGADTDGLTGSQQCGNWRLRDDLHTGSHFPSKRVVLLLLNLTFCKAGQGQQTLG